MQHAYYYLFLFFFQTYPEDHSQLVIGVLSAELRSGFYLKTLFISAVPANYSSLTESPQTTSSICSFIYLSNVYACLWFFQRCSKCLQYTEELEEELQESSQGDRQSWERLGRVGWMTCFCFRKTDTRAIDSTMYVECFKACRSMLV